MLDWILSLFRGSAASLAFFSIFAAGMVFTITSLVFGGDADSDMDHDFDHGGADAHDADAQDGDGHGPGFLSVRGLSLFATGFGGVAYIVQHFTQKVLLSSISGLMFGWVFAFLLIAMLRVFVRQQASSAINPQQVVGAEGVVTTSIPSGNPGEVVLSVAGGQITRMATAADGGAIPQGTAVRVVRYLGGSVSVEKIPSGKEG